jgi:dipeptidyl-peptidase-4
MRRVPLWLLPVALVTVGAASAFAQPPADLLRTLSETRNFSLGRPMSPTPTPDGKSVLFLRSQARQPTLSLYELDLANGQTREVLSPAELLRGADEKLTPEERARRERMRISARGFTSFELSEDGSLLLVGLSGRLYTVRRADRHVEQLSAEQAVSPHLSPDGKKVAYVRDRDLWVLDLVTHKETRLTRSSHPRVSNGLAEFVAQEELDRFDGFWWSPDSSQLAYEEADSRPVELFHLTDGFSPDAATEEIPYPRPGRPNVKVRVGVVPVAGGRTRWLAWDAEKLPYLTRVGWKHGPLTLVVMSRDQKDVRVLSADPASGRTVELIAEHDDVWVTLDPSVPRWLDGKKGFLWSSERSGTRQLELHSPDGKLSRTLSSAEDGYRRLASADEHAGQAWFVGSPEPTESHVYRVALEGGAAERVTQEPGLHDASFGRDPHVWVLRSSGPSLLSKVTVYRDRAPVAELPSVAEPPPFLPKVEYATVGNQRFRALLVRPRDFDPKKKYPVIVDVYAGPHHQQVIRGPGNFMDQWYADHGFIVVAVDGRGTPNRGRDWERAISGNLAEVTLDDQVAGLKALGEKFHELDLQRVGIVGWSFGGYMAALAVLKRPDVFHVGVAGAPVVDWRDYDSAYTERYLGLPADNARGYDASSLLSFAQKLARPLLLIHGTRDDNVYFFHSLKLCDALLRAGKAFEMLPLPGFTHMVQEPSVKEALYARIVGKLSETLLSAKPPRALASDR